MEIRTVNVQVWFLVVTVFVSFLMCFFFMCFFFKAVTVIFEHWTSLLMNNSAFTFKNKEQLKIKYNLILLFFKTIEANHFNISKIIWLSGYHLLIINVFACSPTVEHRSLIFCPSQSPNLGCLTFPELDSQLFFFGAVKIQPSTGGEYEACMHAVCI